MGARLLVPGECPGDRPLSPVTRSERMHCDTKYKRLSSGRFHWWPASATKAAKTLAAHQLQVLFSGGNPEAAQSAPAWRPVGPVA